MYRRQLFIIVSLLCSACLFSCKKKANPNPTGNLLLSNIDVINYRNISHYRIVYDGADNVDSIIMAGGGLDTGHYTLSKINYFGTSFTITDENGDTYTVYANSSGQIFKVLTHDTLNMLYNGVQLAEVDVVTATVTYPFVSKSSTVYTWANGDVTSVSSPGGTFTYDYNTAKIGQIGDPFRIDSFLVYGRPLIKTGHLPTDLLQSGTWAEKYYYQFDGQQRISQLMKVKNMSTGNDTTVYNYRYY